MTISDPTNHSPSSQSSGILPGPLRELGRVRGGGSADSVRTTDGERVVGSEFLTETVISDTGSGAVTVASPSHGGVQAADSLPLLNQSYRRRPPSPSKAVTVRCSESIGYLTPDRLNMIGRIGRVLMPGMEDAA